MAINHLRPLLVAAEERGDVAAWWFIRKGASWRLRVVPAGIRDATAVLGRLNSTLTERAAIRHAEGQQA
ncbi:lantibiotic dehydratase C-terminal domain-containing protein [Streptomyces sp. NPDC056982]|uniref:lantibiotic dehydratase C-terminal domain-containing protein n=1 Tax=Streptomyces sp. NPDC056982 TaxID=3345986 RepID=UPI003627C9C5